MLRVQALLLVLRNAYVLLAGKKVPTKRLVLLNWEKDVLALVPQTALPLMQRVLDLLERNAHVLQTRNQMDQKRQ